MKVRVVSKPGIVGIVLGTEPVATITSSKSPRTPISLTSVLSLTGIPASLISRLYQLSSSLSFSLNVIEEAVMNIPPSSPSFSKIVGLCPRFVSTSAHSIPPIPPPMMATFLGLRVGTILYLWLCIVVGFRAQRARCSESSSFCRLGVPLNLAKLKQPLWQRIQGLISSLRPVLSFVTHSWSTRF